MNKELKAQIVRVFGHQFTFSLIMGLHESEVSKVVRQRKELSVEEQRRWAAALGTEPEKIFPTEETSEHV